MRYLVSSRGRSSPAARSANETHIDVLESAVAVEVGQGRPHKAIDVFLQRAITVSVRTLSAGERERARGPTSELRKLLNTTRLILFSNRSVVCTFSLVASEVPSMSGKYSESCARPGPGQLPEEVDAHIGLE